MSVYLRDDDPEILRTATAIAVLVEQAFKRSDEHPDLSPLDFAVLRYIAQLDDEGVRTPVITQTFNLTTPSGVTLVQRLVDRKVITNEPPEGRQRGRRARLTEHGWNALKSDPLQKALAALIPHLDSDACRSIFEGLIVADYTQARWRDMKLGLDFWR